MYMYMYMSYLLIVYTYMLDTAAGHVWKAPPKKYVNAYCAYKGYSFVCTHVHLYMYVYMFGCTLSESECIVWGHTHQQCVCLVTGAGWGSEGSEGREWWGAGREVCPARRPAHHPWW